MITDDQRYDSLGCTGNPHVKTPHIDSLAAGGVLFERCYSPNPVCAPTRASILTGRYPRAHGLWANGVSLPAHRPFFSRALADAGYRSVTELANQGFQPTWPASGKLAWRT